MSIVVVGAKGQLGWELCRRAKPAGFDVIALDLPEFDIADNHGVQKTLNRPDISLVINASAYTAVDQAESEVELALAVNRDGPAYLASACAATGIPLIHVSTDYVFDGCKNSPYSENDPACPLGVYGKSKVEGEVKVRECLPEHIILRTAWLYGVQGNNFVKTMIRLGKEQTRLRVVADQYGGPTFAGDLADAIFTIAGRIHESDNIPWGTYHFCGQGITSWHGFTEEILTIAKQYISLKVEEVEAITTSDYPTPAQRPAYSAFDCSLINTLFGIKPRPWQESLEEMIRYMFSDENQNLEP